MSRFRISARLSPTPSGMTERVRSARLRYVEALGGKLRVEAEFGDTSYLLAG